MFELTVHFKHEMIGIWQRFQRNFELTVFELTVPDLYVNEGPLLQDKKNYILDIKIQSRQAPVKLYTKAWFDS